MRLGRAYRGQAVFHNMIRCLSWAKQMNNLLLVLKGGFPTVHF